MDHIETLRNEWHESEKSFYSTQDKFRDEPCAFAKVALKAEFWQAELKRNKAYDDLCAAIERKRWSMWEGM